MLKPLLRFALTLLILAAAIFIGYRLWSHYMYSPWTRDGRIRADIISVAPDVAGLVESVAVRDNQAVHKGDLLFSVDASRYRIAAQQATATVAAAQTNQSLKQREARRRATLDAAVVSSENRQSAGAAADAASAQLQEAEAAQSAAQLNLERTQVLAPVDGYVTNLNVHPGDYAVAGHPILALVDLHSFRVEGYFEETKIPSMHVGDEVDIRLMSGGPQLRGHVESIARAIANTDDGGLLSNVNPTFHWVRLAQRIPVRIHIDQIPDGVILSAGMTCTITVQADRHRKSQPAK
ncbi:MAG: efflux RND transporter periplasmic adaptor subunit [Stenotrophobium sp.]